MAGGTSMADGFSRSGAGGHWPLLAATIWMLLGAALQITDNNFKKR